AEAATPDYRDHRTFLIPPLDKPGFYVVAASAREGFQRADNVMTGIYFQVSDLVLSTRHDREGVEAMVQSGQTGQPLEGVEVLVYKRDYQRKHHVVSRLRTDARGAVRLPVLGSDSFFLVARHQGQLTVDPRYLSLYRRPAQGATASAFVFTDRSVYRPLQTLHWKVIAYTGNGERADWRVMTRQPVSVSLLDPNNQVVETKAQTTNEYGTASGEFVIPAGRVLGQWSVRCAPQGWARVRVEEYKRPTFEAKFLESKEPLRLNKPAKVRGEARYYFGLPVTDGKVLWRVQRTPVYPWWYYDWGWVSETQGQVVATGVSRLQADGSFEVAFTPEADERLAATSKELSYRYAVSADVTDEGGETRSASQGFRLGFVAVEASLRLDTAFLLADTPAQALLVRSTLDGVPAPGQGSFRLLALEGPAEALLPADQPLTRAPGDAQPAAFRTEGDDLRSRWQPGYNHRAVLRTWADGAEKAKGELTHDAKGEAKLALPALPPGAYRLRYETVDAFGARYEMSQELLVAGPRAPVALPALLLVEKGSLAVGEKARVWALSGLHGQPLVLDVHREQRLVERRILDSDRDAQLIEIPVTEEMRGGFGVSLHVLRDHQAMVQSHSVFVPWDTKQLKLEFATFRDKLRPGARETWTVKVTDAAGKQPVGKAAELLAYMYDKSLDIFAPHSPPSPISLFPHRGSPVAAQPHLGAGPHAWFRSEGFRPRAAYPSVLPDRLVFPDGYGVGGPGRRGGRFAHAQRAMSREEGAMPPAPAAAAAPMPEEASADESKAERKKVAGAKATGEAAEAEKDSRDAEAPGGGEAAPAPAAEVRTNFSETAFFLPHLVASPDGTAALEFQVPDSVTAWNVWVHGITADLRSGSLHKETRSVKDLMVRPYLPRFLREGDRAVLKVVVNNASDKPLSGKLTLEVFDPDTNKDLLGEFGLKAAEVRDRPFQVEPGGGANLSFELMTPARVGPIAVRVIATSGDLSDGELRPLPVLPGRMHLAQSRFVTLKDKARRELHFADMAKDDDPSLIHESLVVTLDAQLFYSVLSALPYLVNYPYECTEQTLNRFLSTGIVTSMYKRYPAIERMARKFSERKTQLEEWAAPDPNRKMALEETPWLQEAKGGADPGYELVNVLDSRIARAHRDDALAKLRKAQTASGGFPWFPGGPPDDWMTLYLLYGFSKGIEFQVDVPKDMTQRAWSYLHRHYIDEIVREMRAHDCCWEEVTFLNYVLSNYPDASWSGGVFSDDERKEMLAHSFKHWKAHSPYLKGYLALTLKRMGRPQDARLVWESVMDSAKTAEDQGTFWAPEDRGWLWYNDTIETHAFAVRTVMEITPEEPKLDGLVLWLFLNKKLGHWKSTRATAEVIYSLLHYLKKTEQLGTREAATVSVGPDKREFVFEPDEYTGKKNQIVVPGDKIDAKAHSTVVVEKDTKGFMFASATWHFSTERMPTEERGDYLQVSRAFFKREKQGRETKLRPLAEGEKLQPGDEVEVQLSMRAKHPMDYVHLRDPRGAGFEPVSQISRHRWDLGLYYYEEVRDSGQNFFFSHLPQGEYTFKYRVRAALAGSYKVSPATVQPMYAPEFNAYSAGHVLTIAPSE
ncbi:MAG TPA: MG2 domain-containing protein, partial [Myxococcota bacterium]|nr:MG2 domain-containing protein [Myxococcota bacterium]